MVYVPSGIRPGALGVRVGGRRVPADAHIDILEREHVARFVPETARPGDRVEIHGAGIAREGATVRFGGDVTAPAQVAERGRLVVYVPDGAASGPVTVEFESGPSITGPAALEIDASEAGLRITGISSECASPGCEVTLHGHGFGTDPAGVAVHFGGDDVEVVAVGAGHLRVRLPATTRRARFRVQVGETQTVSGAFESRPAADDEASRDGGAEGVDGDAAPEEGEG